MLLTGPVGITICFRCVTALLSQVRDDEQRRGCTYAGVTVQDYAFMSADELRTRTRDILKGGARWYPLTWAHKRKDAISNCMYRSASGIRVRVCTDLMPVPLGWITEDAPTEGPPTDSRASFHPGMPRKPLSRRCAFCQQDWKNVPGMGRNKHANPAIPDAGTLQVTDLNLEICYECIVLANDTFEQAGSVFATASDAEENVPVIWTPTDNGEPRHPPFSLAQVIAFCFDNRPESVGSWGIRFCPFLTPMEAHAAFEAWALEATVWKGPPLLRSENSSGSRRVAWSDLRIKLAGTGIVVWIDGEREVEKWWRTPEIFNQFPWEETHVWDEK